MDKRQDNTVCVTANRVGVKYLSLPFSITSVAGTVILFVNSDLPSLQRFNGYMTQFCHAHVSFRSLIHYMTDEIQIETVMLKHNISSV